MDNTLDNHEIPAKPQPPLKWIYGINLAILFLYITFLHPDPYLAGKAFCIVIQVGLNLFTAIVFLLVKSQRHLAGPFFLSALLVLLIGFGACVAREQIAL
jgi:hypothetical protein